MKLGNSTPKLQQRKFMDIRSSLQKPLDLLYQNYEIKWLKEILTLKQEMKTDDDDATMRESFSLVQNILFIGYNDVLLLKLKTTLGLFASSYLRKRDSPGHPPGHGKI